MITEQHGLCAGLDYYKPTMSQLAYEQEPGAEVTFTFHNRGEQQLLDYVDTDALTARFDQLRDRGWSQKELRFLGSLQTPDMQPVFTPEYMEFLGTHPLPAVHVKRSDTTRDLDIQTTGPWALSTFWETVVMSEVNEAYFKNYLDTHTLDPQAVYREGDHRLDEKVALLQANPDVTIADFGTRRHFSHSWQKHIVGRLLNECPDNLIGTSNIALAEYYGIRPIGTFAHEMPMVYAGLAEARGQDIRSSHTTFLQDWYKRYGHSLSIALTDTFTSNFFFDDFTPEQAEAWRGVRHDSGDPYEFGERLLDFYQDLGINPLQKTVVFSDGLDIKQIVDLRRHFGSRINTLFGWGTTLTNDLGLQPLNIVMKATSVRLPETGQAAETVKLSDNKGKHTGSPAHIAQYQAVFTGS